MNGQPSVGRIVHYVSYGTPGGEYTSQCRAAVVTEVGPLYEPSSGHVVGLCVLNPEGMYFTRDVEPDEGAPFVAGMERRPRRSGSWHWPERV